MSFIQTVQGWINLNPGKTLGALSGFILGVLLFTFGILKTLVIILLVALGFFLGKARDDNIPVIDQVTALFTKKREDQ